MTLLDFHLSSIAENYEKRDRLTKSYAVTHCNVVSYITANRSTMSYEDYKNQCIGIYKANEETFNTYKAQEWAV